MVTFYQRVYFVYASLLCGHISSPQSDSQSDGGKSVLRARALQAIKVLSVYICDFEHSPWNINEM